QVAEEGALATPAPAHDDEDVAPPDREGEVPLDDPRAIGHVELAHRNAGLPVGHGLRAREAIGVSGSPFPKPKAEGRGTVGGGAFGGGGRPRTSQSPKMSKITVMTASNKMMLTMPVTTAEVAAAPTALALRPLCMPRRQPAMATSTPKIDPLMR